MQDGLPAHPPIRQRILIVDDHPLMRAGIAAMIQTEPDLEVCGEAAGISETLALSQDIAVDLIVLDLNLRDGSGLELISRLKARHEGVRVLVCSMHDESLFAERALQAGAMGYLNKQEASAQVILAIRQVLDGKIYLSDSMTERTLRRIGGKGVSSGIARIDNLTNRELEVFALIGRGLGMSQIAEQIHLSVKTVEAHRNKIKKKLSLGSTGEVAREAYQWTLEQG